MLTPMKMHQQNKIEMKPINKNRSNKEAASV